MAATRKRGGSRPPVVAGGQWGVWDSEKDCLYVPCLAPSEAGAMAERENLLKHFPENHPWRRRLTVRQVGEGAAVGRASAGSEPSTAAKRRNRQEKAV